MTFQSRQTPQLAAVLGFQSNPLAVASGGILLSTLCTIPDEANGCWIQEEGLSNNPLKFRMDGSSAWGAGSDAMELYSPNFLQLTNRAQMQQASLASSSGTKEVRVTFFTGQVGPLGAPPKVSIVTGVIPPPPPGIGAVPTINTVHVMKNTGGSGGDDATGARNRLDLPFLTIEAAMAVAQPGDTVYIWPGQYDLAASLGADLVNIYRLGASLTAPSGIGYLFDADGKSFEVRGWGALIDTDNGLVYAANGGRLLIDGDMEGSAAGVEANGAELIINGNIDCLGTAVIGSNSAEITVNGNLTASGTIGVQGASGALITINGSVTAASSIVTANFAAVVISGNCASAADAAIDASNSANVTITGAVNAGGTGVAADSATVNVNGALSTSGLAVNAIADAVVNIAGKIISGGGAGITLASAAICTVHGDIEANGGGGVEVQGSSIYNQEGSILSVGVGILVGRGSARVTNNVYSTGAEGARTTGDEARLWVGGDITTDTNYGADCSDGIMIVQGSCINNGAGNAASCTAGFQTIYGNCYTSMSGAGPSAGVGGTGVQVIYGDCVNDGAGPGAKTLGGTQTIYGNCIANVSGNGAFCQGGYQAVHGNCHAQDSFGASIDVGEQYLYGIITTGVANGAACEMSSLGSTIYLMATARLEANGAATASIEDAAAGTVRSYFASANVIVGPTIVLVGTLNIIV